MLVWRGNLVAWWELRERAQDCLGVFDVSIQCLWTCPRGSMCRCVCATRVHGNALCILPRYAFMTSSLSAGAFALLVPDCWPRLHLAPRGILACFPQADHSFGLLHTSQSSTCFLAPTRSCAFFEDK